jgi:hypothetical protein
MLVCFCGDQIYKLNQPKAEFERSYSTAVIDMIVKHNKAERI